MTLSADATCDSKCIPIHTDCKCFGYSEDSKEQFCGSRDKENPNIIYACNSGCCNTNGKGGCPGQLCDEKRIEYVVPQDIVSNIDEVDKSTFSFSLKSKRIIIITVSIIALIILIITTLLSLSLTSYPTISDLKNLN
tara:strand:+ start:2848 stop:3258 length:411 start_codon:yes stop_codon:yes gene_type:complete